MQVCKHCGSMAVARCKWVNVNTGEVYSNKDSGTTLEWCMECEDETVIINKEDWYDLENGDADENDFPGFSDPFPLPYL